MQSLAIVSCQIHPLTGFCPKTKPVRATVDKISIKMTNGDKLGDVELVVSGSLRPWNLACGYFPHINSWKPN